MKYLLILGLLAAVGLLLYWRLRPYIHFARRVLGMLRDAGRVGATVRTETSIPQQRAGAPTAQQRLVRCAACGTWTPAARALAPRGSSASVYCSQDCLERAAADASPQQQHRSSESTGS